MNELIKRAGHAPPPRPPTFVALSLVLCLSAGCAPYLHTTPRSPEVRGRVLDARTRTPVEGAKVFLTEHPSVSTVSDGEGYFRLKVTRNFHYAATVPEGHLPAPEYWGAAITVSRTNYITYLQAGPDARWVA